MSAEPDTIDYSDHDPLAPMSAQMESELLAVIHSTPDTHPDADFCCKYQPLDLRACKDA